MGVVLFERGRDQPVQPWPRPRRHQARHAAQVIACGTVRRGGSRRAWRRPTRGHAADTRGHAAGGAGGPVTGRGVRTGPNGQAGPAKPDAWWSGSQQASAERNTVAGCLLLAARISMFVERKAGQDRGQEQGAAAAARATPATERAPSAATTEEIVTPASFAGWACDRDNGDTFRAPAQPQSKLQSTMSSDFFGALIGWLVAPAHQRGSLRSEETIALDGRSSTPP